MVTSDVSIVHHIMVDIDQYNGKSNGCPNWTWKWYWQ